MRYLRDNSSGAATLFLASWMPQGLKNLPAMQENTGDVCLVHLNGEDSLEKEMAAHFIILAWEIPWTEKSGGLHSVGSQRSDVTE